MSESTEEVAQEETEAPDNQEDSALLDGTVDDSLLDGDDNPPAEEDPVRRHLQCVTMLRYIPTSYGKYWNLWDRAK